MSLLIESPGRSQARRFAHTAGSALALAKPLVVAILRSMGESELAPSCAPTWVAQRAGHTLVPGLRGLRVREMVEA